MAKVVFGNRVLSQADIVAVAVDRRPVEVDLAIFDKAPDAGEAEPVAPLEASEPALSAPASLAILAACLGVLTQEKTLARKAVLQHLVDMLNAEDAPALSSSSVTDGVLATVGAGSGLTAKEHAALSTSTAPAAGMLALVAASTTALAVVTDAVAALSVEAAAAPVAPYDSAWFDTARPHPSTVLSAGTLRVMLMNSKLAAASGKKDKVALPSGPWTHAAFASAPDLHAPARTAGALAKRAARVELNAAALPRAPTCTAAYELVQQCQRGLSALAGAAVARTHIVAGAQPPSLPPAPPADALVPTAADVVQLGSATLAAAQRLVSALVSEFQAAETVLRGCEAEAATKAAAKAAKRAEAVAKQQAKEEAAAAKRAAELAAMDPEARAKAEAADAAKAAKAAAKAAKRAAKDANTTTVLPGDSGLLSLGDGTRRLLALLRLRGGVACSEQGSAPEPVPAAALTAAFDPHTPEGAFATAAAIVAAVEDIASGGGKRRPKIPKGSRDFGPEQMAVRERAFTTIRSVFKRHGAAEIDTPVFELRETLLGKYGEEGGKLIYDLADQGGELLSLRYDLTVPFARYCAQHGVASMKRFHISKVYRRDNVNISRGRYREFYQCDYDVAGTYAAMMPDAEVLAVACDILRSLPIGPFTVKFNHRGLLDGMLELAGVPPAKFRTICSSIDKLDKEPWTSVREEMVAEKGLEGAVADRIGELVQVAGQPEEVLSRLQSDEFPFSGHAGAAAALKDCGLLFTYLKAMGVLEHLSFDLSLARGLDYYTGVIYEAVLTPPPQTAASGSGAAVADPALSVGSIAAGGRYDGLVGMFSPTGTQVPCVGVSIGIERVFTIMEARAKAAGTLRQDPVTVLVASVGKGMVPARLALCAELWEAGFSAETLYAANPNMRAQLNNKALPEGIPFMVTVGEDELASGTVKVKDLASEVEEVVQRGQLPAKLKAWGAKTVAGAPPPPPPAAAAAETVPAPAVPAE